MFSHDESIDFGEKSSVIYNKIAIKYLKNLHDITNRDMFIDTKEQKKLSDVFFISFASLVLVDDTAAKGGLNGDHEDAVVLTVRVQTGELICLIEPLEGLGTSVVVISTGW